MTKNPKMPKFKAVVERPIYVRIKGSRTYHTAKSEKDVERIKKELLEEARAEWERKKGEAARNEQEDEFIIDNTRRYIDYIKKRLWHMVRDGTNKEVVQAYKEVKSILSGILSGTKRVEWQQSYVNDTDYYTIKTVKDYGRDV